MNDGPATLPRQSSLGYQVNHLARLMAQALRERIAPFGVVPGQFAQLLALYEQDASRAFELGADAYVTKPFDPVEVVGQVEGLLALSSAELRTSRERELDRSRLLSQLESILGEG